MKPADACQEWSEALVTLVMGDHDPSQIEPIRAHLARCAACRALYEALVVEEPALRSAFAALAAAAESTAFSATPTTHAAPTTPAPSFATRPAVGPRTGTTTHHHPFAGLLNLLFGRHAMAAKLFVPVALAAVVLVLVGIWPSLSPTPRAYGMTDLPELLNDGVLHIRGEMFLPPLAPPGQERTRIETEYWLDPRGGRSRQTLPSYNVTGAGTAVTKVERVVDGNYIMIKDCAARTVEYMRLNDFYRVLEQRRSLATLLDQFLGGKALEPFRATGTETIAGVVYTVWQYTLDDTDDGTSYRAECLIDGVGGAVGGARTYMRQGPTAEWQLIMRMGPWGRVADPPAYVFATEPPDGYTDKNTRDTAELPGLHFEGGGTGDGISHTGYIAFRLPNGSVLFAWSSRDQESTASQGELFAGLRFGGPLPKLPMVMAGLEQNDGDRTISYTGRHVAWAPYGDDFVEWALYVPHDDPPPKWVLYYRIVPIYHLPLGRIAPEILANISQPFWIESAKEFDVLALGAMAELSDIGEVPADISFERVMTLAAEVRARR